MFGENDTNYWAEKTEYSTPTCAIGGKSGLKNGTLGDYFGLPTEIKNKINVNALPARAYAMIYNEWFRDENLEAPLMLGYKKSDDGAANENPATNGKQTVTQNPHIGRSKNAFATAVFTTWKGRKYRDWETDRKSTRLNSSHITRSRMPSSA